MSTVKLCALCLDKEVSSIKSHIFSWSLIWPFVVLRGDKNREKLYAFTTEGVFDPSISIGSGINPDNFREAFGSELDYEAANFLQDPFIETYIFCKDCEGKMGKIEEVGPSLLSKLEFPTESSAEVKCTPITPGLELLFWMQIFRASVASTKLFRNYKLPPKIESVLQKRVYAGCYNLQPPEEEMNGWEICSFITDTEPYQESVELGKTRENIFAGSFGGLHICAIGNLYVTLNEFSVEIPMEQLAREGLSNLTGITAELTTTRRKTPELQHNIFCLHAEIGKSIRQELQSKSVLDAIWSVHFFFIRWFVHEFSKTPDIELINKYALAFSEKLKSESKRHLNNAESEMLAKEVTEENQTTQC